MRWLTAAVVLALLAPGREGSAQPGPASGREPSAARLADVSEIRRRLGLVSEYQNVPGVEAVKVAVLDYGFDGIESDRPYLPESAVVVEHYNPDFVRRFRLGDPDFRKGFEPGNRHGRLMAQIVWAVTGSRPGGPQFYLLNANGPTMLRRAVRFAIEHKVGVILFSGSFEGGGNGDGRGPINRVVSEALAAGIIWVNAAGNYGHRVYNGPVRVLSDGYLRLRDGADVAALRFRNHLDENTVTVTLTWNDYRGEEDAGTDRDLDLYVEDWAGRRVGSGARVQITDSQASGPDRSRNPRERVVLEDLPASPVVAADPDYTYRIRIRAKRGRFTANDRLRVLLTATHETYIPPGGGPPREALEFLDASGEEELYPPADHPLVLTIGDASPDSSVGPTADRRVKPDAILEDSRAFFTDGEITAGSSNAAAYVAGVVAVLKAVEPRLRPSHLLRLAQQGPAATRNTARPLQAASATGPRPLTTSATRPAPSSGLTLRIWQTPTRARLAEVVRYDR